MPEQIADYIGFVYVMDNEPDARKSLYVLAESIGLKTIECASSGEFFAQFDDKVCACVVADLRQGGLQLLRECEARNLECPIILTAGSPLVEETVEAMRAGAFDFMTKPFTERRTVNTLLDAILVSAEQRTARIEKAAATKALSKLSEREWDVAQLIVEGLDIEDIERRLNLSHDEVATYCRNIFSKTGARTFGALTSLFKAANQTYSGLHPE
jgi:two-component system, LuxR family, response regulator FixJ